MSTAWRLTLDECEARLDAATASLDAGVEPPAVAPFPAGGPAEAFPVELVDRALALVARGAEVERRLEGERDRVATELRRLPRARARQTHPESHFELKA